MMENPLISIACENFGRSYGSQVNHPSPSSAALGAFVAPKGPVDLLAGLADRFGTPLWLRAFVAKNTKSLVFSGATHHRSSLPFDDQWSG